METDAGDLEGHTRWPPWPSQGLKDRPWESDSRLLCSWPEEADLAIRQTPQLGLPLHKVSLLCLISAACGAGHLPSSLLLSTGPSGGKEGIWTEGSRKGLLCSPSPHSLRNIRSVGVGGDLSPT